MIEFRQCLPSDLEAVLELNQRVYDSLADKSLLRLNSIEMIASCLAEPNVTMGAWYGDKLVAIGILYVPQTDDEDLSHYVENAVFPAANQKLYLVDAAYRGQGLQRIIIRLIEDIARKKGFVMLCTTIAPHNTFSINNFIAEGYTYSTTVVKYGGLKRNIYYKVL